MLEQTKKFNSAIKLYMFQTGTLKTKLKYIKMNQSNEDFEIPVPWFLIKHPHGNVVIDGGIAIEVAIEKHAHWGSVVNAYDPVMTKYENCVEQTKSIGVNVEKTKKILILVSTLITAAAVSFSGLIGFVGLVAPHAVRLLWGTDYRTLIPMSAVVGGSFLVISDLIARTVVSPGELPVGIITAIFGAPFFIYLLIKKKSEIS